jgi:transcriptional regulator with XRE-family HTH domain
MSVDDLAEVVRICPNWLESIEKGIFGPSQPMLGQLALALRVSVDQLTEE